MTSSTESSVTLRGCADLLASVPYLLGFHPADSIVVVALRDGTIAFAARGDLPGPSLPAGAVAARFVALLVRERVQAVTLVGYGPAARVTAAVDAVRDALGGTRVSVLDVLRVEDGRYWSYVCSDPSCCPPEGTPFVASTARVAAAAVYAGQVALPDREAVVRQIAPLTGPARAAMTAATHRAEQRLRELLAEPALDPPAASATNLTLSVPDPIAAERDPQPVAGVGKVVSHDLRALIGLGSSSRPGTVRPGQRRWAIGEMSRRATQSRALLRAGHEAVDTAFARHRRGERLTDDEVAWLSVLLMHGPVRDHAWEHMGADEWQVSLWTDVLRRVEPDLAAAPGGLLSFAAWRAGHGVLAVAAAERALLCEPAYTMALLMEQVLEQCLSPTEWDRSVHRSRARRSARRRRRRGGQSAMRS